MNAICEFQRYSTQLLKSSIRGKVMVIMVFTQITLFYPQINLKLL